jgi:hypothetical protein
MLSLFAAVALGALGVLLGPVAPAQAANGERIRSYDVSLDIRTDGGLVVTETLLYDFGASDKHGIFRKIPARFHFDKTRDREYPISGVDVRMDDGQRVPVSRSEDGGYDVLKIGDPDRTVTGSHTYTISYVVRGALNTFPDHLELYWNAIGNEWPAPIDQATARVTTPATVEKVACFAGPKESRSPCATAGNSGRFATFSENSLDVNEGMSVVVQLPLGSVNNAGKVLVPRRDAAAAFRMTPVTLGVTAAVSLLSIAGVFALIWSRGRDRRYAGQIPGLAPVSGQQDAEERVPLFGRKPVVVEFAPPEGVRPGQVGTLQDEQAQVVDVTATLIDFGVRGHLHISELERGGVFSKQDWLIERRTEGDPNFLPYERQLFDALFTGRDQVKLSELKNTFATHLRRTQKLLYEDVVSQGWFRRSPESTRAGGRALGFVLLAGAGGITFLLAKTTHFALVGIGLVIGALTFLIFASRLPSRTSKGNAMLARVEGFRLYLNTAEAEQIQWEEREQIFSRYLPYAMVFGVADRWAKQFQSLATQQADGGSGLYWYAGQPGWNMLYFSHSIGSFSTTASGTIASTPPSASGSSGFGGGGFSGGGGGGGGGGSW